MGSHLMNIINLGNSIIGVSILAMPYCFQRCGILLSLLLIIVSGVLVRSACYLLLKGAVTARRRNFAFLAFHAFGSSGKLAVEIGIIGFLIGVCIAFFVVIGDLGPPLVSQYLIIENTPNLRVMVLVLLGFFVALPLGMLRKVDSLTSLSALSIAFYGWLVLKIFSEASAQIISNEWWHKVNWWEPSGILPCLPIFSMALSCQTQLFEFFDTQSEPSMKRMMSVVSGAVFLCSTVYIMVGVFGYISCYDKIITGNILVNLTPSIMTECIKIGFIFTLAISFPLCLFPCRTSLHSLLFKQALAHHDIAVNFIPDHRFRLLTVSLVIITIGVAIMIPNIEFVLGIIGSTIGTAICLIFPAVIFIHDTNKETTEKRMAQVIMCIGIFILLACTYTTLQEGTQTQREVRNLPVPHQPLVVEMPLISKAISISPFLQGKSESPGLDGRKIEAEVKKIEKELEVKKGLEEKRQEPPVPHESDTKVKSNPAPADLDPQALQKEDKEIQKDILNSLTSASSIDISLKEKQELLIRKLEEQNKEQKILIEEQKKVLQEMKLHQEMHGEIDRENPALKMQKSTASSAQRDRMEILPKKQKYDSKLNGINKMDDGVQQQLGQKDFPDKNLVQNNVPNLQNNVPDWNVNKRVNITQEISPKKVLDNGDALVKTLQKSKPDNEVVAPPIRQIKDAPSYTENLAVNQKKNALNLSDQKLFSDVKAVTFKPEKPPHMNLNNVQIKETKVKEVNILPSPKTVVTSNPDLQANDMANVPHLLPRKEQLSINETLKLQEPLDEVKKHEMK